MNSTTFRPSRLQSTGVAVKPEFGSTEGSLTIRILGLTSGDSELSSIWNSLVERTSRSGIMQTTAWARFKQRQGLNVRHLGVFEYARLVGGVTLYAAKNPRGAGILFAPEGPVLDWDNEPQSAKALRLIMDCAERIAIDSGCMALRIEPRLTGPQPRLLREFGNAPVDFVPKETLYIDLLADEDTILRRMHAKGRYNIRLSQRHGVTVTESTDPDDAHAFYDLLTQASLRDNFALEPLQFFQDMVSTLCPEGKARMLFAKHGEDLLGAMLLVTCGLRATYLYGGISNVKRNLMAGYALQWQAIRLSKQLGCTEYDMYGFDSFMSPSHAYSRFSQFKRKFGGEVKRFIGGQEHFFVDCLTDVFIRAVNKAGVLAKSSESFSEVENGAY